MTHHPTGEMWRLAPFILLSLMLHMALLFALRLPTNIRSRPVPHPLTVTFVPAPFIERALIPNNIPSTKQDNSTRLLTASDTPASQFTEQPDIKRSQDRPSETNSPQLMESALGFARNEANQWSNNTRLRSRKSALHPLFCGRISPATSQGNPPRQRYAKESPTACRSSLFSARTVFCARHARFVRHSYDLPLNSE